jgi:hypothetical protein
MSALFLVLPEIVELNVPCTKLQNAGVITLGANRAVHLYCAPTVGFLILSQLHRLQGLRKTYIEAISPRETASAVEPIDANNAPYTNEIGPPLRRPDWKLTAKDSQEACRVSPKAIAGFKLRYRC